MARRRHSEYREPFRIPLALQITIVVVLAAAAAALVIAATLHVK